MADLFKVMTCKTPVYHTCFGNVIKDPFKRTLNAAQVADVAYFGGLPAGARVLSVKVGREALGAGATVDVGYLARALNGTLVDDPDAFFAALDVSAAGSDTYEPDLAVTLDEDTYVVATVGGAAATGDIEITVEYLWDQQPDS